MKPLVDLVSESYGTLMSLISANVEEFVNDVFGGDS
jgi:hypothetical protein